MTSTSEDQANGEIRFKSVFTGPETNVYESTVNGLYIKIYLHKNLEGKYLGVGVTHCPAMEMS